MSPDSAIKDTGAAGQSDPAAKNDPAPSRPEPPTFLPLDNNIAMTWLREGWRDMVRSRFVGVVYGFAFVMMGFMIANVYANYWQLTMGLIAGFFLVGPFLSTGIYDLSRQLDQDGKSSLLKSFVCWRRNLGAISFFSLILTFAMIVWARVSLIIFALFSTTDFPTLQTILSTVFSADNIGFLAIWALVGFVFASAIFAIGAVSAPMMLDRKSDTMSAIFASAQCLYRSPRAMFTWAAAIVIIIGASLLLGFVPLLITAPLIGHATWRAYKSCLTFSTPAP
ncbi:MAG: DUF2189 domain-containing protein [Burkholderiaceae bacterium]